MKTRTSFAFDIISFNEYKKINLIIKEHDIQLMINNNLLIIYCNKIIFFRFFDYFVLNLKHLTTQAV